MSQNLRSLQEFAEIAKKKKKKNSKVEVIKKLCRRSSICSSSLQHLVVGEFSSSWSIKERLSNDDCLIWLYSLNESLNDAAVRDTILDQQYNEFLYFFVLLWLHI